MSKLYIYDLYTKKAKVSQNDVLPIGAAAACVVSTNLENVGVFMQKDDLWTFYPSGDVDGYRIGGEAVAQATRLENERPVLMAIDGALLFLFATAGGVPEMLFTLASDSWYIYDEGWKGAYTVGQLTTLRNTYPEETFVSLAGSTDPLSYCTLGDILEYAKRNGLMQPAPPKHQETASDVRARILGAPSGGREEEEADPDAPEIDELNGKYVCPVCWLRFNLGDVMSIASHPDLMGDKVLGRDAMKRFWATRFNSLGQALDEKGMPCRDIACPHCRRKLPPQYLNMKGHIFSIIGAPSSGKSYYLSSLVHELENSVASRTDLIWQDADPSGNSLLNDAINRLFSSDSPEDAYLSKTDLEGALYEEFYRHGRMVKLPRPFVFNVSKAVSRTAPVSAVFYDNAGEHFEPGRDSEDSPGAQHVAVASGLFFLYDPTTSRAMRQALQDKDDPQLHGKMVHVDQQITILRETIVRISSILNLPPGEKIDTPLAVMIGKSDLWEDKLEGGPLLPAVSEQGEVIHKNIDANSHRLRAYLKQFAPSICAYAEQISTQVRYFAVSSLGCSPITFTDPVSGAVKIGPDPAKVQPRHVEDPLLWILNLLEPSIVPAAK